MVSSGNLFFMARYWVLVSSLKIYGTIAHHASQVMIGSLHIPSRTLSKGMQVVSTNIFFYFMTPEGFNRTMHGVTKKIKMHTT